MNEFNSYWVSSVARTGSMWTTNVVREIFNFTKFNVFPLESIKSDSDWVHLYKENAFLDKNKMNKYVLKVHSKIKSIPPRSKVITNIRNPYDICASYHEFMKCNLIKSINSALLLKDFVDHYKTISKNIFIIKYENIELKPETLINELALFCNTKLSETQIENIVIKYDKKNIKKLIEKNDQDLKETINQKQKIDKHKVVEDENGNLRSFDLNTGFQSGHISSRKTGDWRKIFSKEDIDTIIKKIDPIAVQLGYTSEKK